MLIWTNARMSLCSTHLGIKGGLPCRDSLPPSLLKSPPRQLVFFLMLPKFGSVLLAVGTLVGWLAPSVSALGSTCSTPLTTGSAGPNDPFWMQNIAHQGGNSFPRENVSYSCATGLAPYNSQGTGYQVFRNVKVCTSRGVTWIVAGL